MQKPTLPAVVLRSAVLAGVLVGLVDGIRAAWLAHGSVTGFLGCVALAAGFDLVVASVAGVGLAFLMAVAGWGRSRKAGLAASAVGWLLAGGIAAGAAAAAVSGTAARNNRFLAAGVVALVSLAAAVGATFVGPALARMVGFIPGLRSGNQRQAKPLTPAGVLLLAPLATLLVEIGIFFVVWRTRAPLRKDVLASRAGWAAILAAAIPFVLLVASSRLARLRLWQSVLGAMGLFGVPLGVLLQVRWVKDFQFMPWAQVLVIAGLVVGTAVLAFWFRDRTAHAKAKLALMLAPLVAVVAVFTVSESESARKAASMHAGLAGQLLAQGQRLFDSDHDGYARFFGGGDCDDRDPERNPAARDWPDDGIDQDCDGKDATAAALRSPPFQPVPDAVPQELKILLVTIDTLRADHVGAYGYSRPTTANLDRLAGQSTVFENGWAHAPSTRYSMPAIATGRWPSAIDWDESIWWPRIAPTQRMIAESLKGLGYTTAAFYAYLYFNRADQRGFERAIDYYDDSCAALHVNVNGPAESVGTSARQMADKGIDFLRTHGQEKFFLWMHFYDPHLNYERHAEAPDFGKSQTDLYDGEIWFTDQQFGRVLDELRTQGLWDKTAIIVVGDHGESLGEHGIVAHGYHLYTPHTKVPFIVRVPGLPAQRLAAPVGHVDLAPTMLNLARGAHESSFLGRSLVDLLAGRPADPPPGPVFQEVSYEGNVKRRALVTANHHLIWNWTPDNTTECYDIAHDPGELKDLWGSAGQPACTQLKDEVRAKVALLSLPSGYADKMAFGLASGGAPMHVLDASIGPSLRVLGSDLALPTVRRGGGAELVTHFKLAGKLEPGWRLFFHLEGPAGFRNLDHVPVEGVYPMERWRPGQHIRDRMHVTFTPAMPPGVYTVYVGLFKGSARQPVSPASLSDGHDRLRIATIVVE